MTTKKDWILMAMAKFDLAQKIDDADEELSHEDILENGLYWVEQAANLLEEKGYFSEENVHTKHND